MNFGIASALKRIMNTIISRGYWETTGNWNNLLLLVLAVIGFEIAYVNGAFSSSDNDLNIIERHTTTSKPITPLYQLP
jgi:hypothetical protein